MTLEVEVEHRMRRHVLMYFSIVRRSACWASFVSLSTSVSNTTEKQKEKSESDVGPRKGMVSYMCKLMFWTFEFSLSARLDLLRLRHGFDELLNHHTVLVSSIAVKATTSLNSYPVLAICDSHVFDLPWVDFQVVVASYSVDFNFLL